MVSIFGIVPILIALILTILRPLLNRGDTEAFSSFFPNFTFILFLHFLVPITALFQGTGIIADEVEDKTLPYLIIRPVPRYLVIMAKYLACVFIGGTIVIGSLCVSYGIGLLGASSNTLSSDIVFLLHSSAILLLGLAVYSVLFSLLGGIFKHPMVGGLLFVFGWEKIIAYVPGNAKFFTVMNYLLALYPSSEQIHLPWTSSVISNITAIFILCFLLLIFGGISFLLPSLKEYP